VEVTRSQHRRTQGREGYAALGDLLRRRPVDGDERIERFYIDHAGAVQAYLVGLCRDRTLAEDLLHETFVKATRSLGGYRGGSPRSWLFAIARTTFLDHVRRRREDATAEPPEVAVHDPDLATVHTVRQVLAALPESQRSALILRDQLDLPYAEVAAALGKSLGATKVLIHRARAAFRLAYASCD
jgi:RNA polymerase sigma-70 factor, ECF subfamily